MSTLEMTPEETGLFFRKWLAKFNDVEWKSTNRISMDELFEKHVAGYANRDIVFRSHTQELIQTLKAMRSTMDTSEDNLPDGWHRIVGPTDDFHVVNGTKYPGRIFVFCRPNQDSGSFFLRVPAMREMQKAIDVHGLSSLCVPDATLITWASRDEIETLNERDCCYKFVIVMDFRYRDKVSTEEAFVANGQLWNRERVVIVSPYNFIKCQIAQLCCLGFPISKTFWTYQYNEPGKKGFSKKLIVMPSHMPCFSAYTPENKFRSHKISMTCLALEGFDKSWAFERDKRSAFDKLARPAARPDNAMSSPLSRLQIAQRSLEHLSLDCNAPFYEDVRLANGKDQHQVLDVLRTDQNDVYNIALYELKCNRLAHDRFVAMMSPKSGPSQNPEPDNSGASGGLC